MIALSPRQKMLGLGACVTVLATAALFANGSLTTGARVLLGGAALLGLGLWAIAQTGASGRRGFARTPRMQVIQKIGLSARAGVALVDVDGRSFLIVHGDGGTRVRRVSSRAAVMAQAVKER